jgi:hypothetical protein
MDKGTRSSNPHPGMLIISSSHAKYWVFFSFSLPFKKVYKIYLIEE